MIKHIEKGDRVQATIQLGEYTEDGDWRRTGEEVRVGTVLDPNATDRKVANCTVKILWDTGRITWTDPTILQETTP